MVAHPAMDNLPSALPVEKLQLVFAFVAVFVVWGAMLFMHFRTGGDGVGVGMGVGVDVDGAVVVGASPGAVIDEDGVAAPSEAGAVPAVDAEGRADGDGWAEADAC